MNMLKKGDLYLIGLIFLVVVLGMAFINIAKKQKENGSIIAVIKQDGRIIERVNLDNVTEQRRIDIDGDYKQTIIVEKGRIKFESAECPDKVCVKAGWLEKAGHMAVCVPNRTMIKIEGASGKLDGVSY